MIVQKRFLVSGRVQGVGFRSAVYEQARNLGELVGFVKNLPSGQVEIVVRGDGEKVMALFHWCKRGPRTAQVTHVEIEDSNCRLSEQAFQIGF